MGKKWERMLFFPFPFLYFLAPFFSVFGQNHEKQVKKGAEQWKNGRKDEERGRGAVLALSKFLNLVRFRFLFCLKPIFAPFKTYSWPHSNPILALFQSHFCPFPNPFWPLSKPVPGLFCIAHLSYLDTCHLQPNHWTTLDHHRSTDQWEVCICGEEKLGTSLHDMYAPLHGSKRSDAVRKARA